jgi:hypothetical protein
MFSERNILSVPLWPSYIRTDYLQCVTVSFVHYRGDILGVRSQCDTSIPLYAIVLHNPLIPLNCKHKQARSPHASPHQELKYKKLF